ncbi:SpoIIE family protein phosphatase [Borrelia anserina]|uniref:Stage II sporulation protein E n=2 Tax=Borrelia anserina TaxID=143 RepID=W5STZ8_BORAN|nr:SpoIIE family protein phosphatase [Borrelia anserina]AHH08501.1 Stage II sporulation protein E [Borrelia anserina BA2]APR64971.1 regulator [Borrelia anserina Es]UPA06894.1 SpoIIE family protein phosphatase [Borrelia anserina]
MNSNNVISILNEFSLKLEEIFLLINTYSYELYKETPRYFYDDITNYLELTLEVANKFQGEFEGFQELNLGKFLIRSMKCDLISYLYLSLELIENSMLYSEIKDTGIAFFKAIACKISSIISYVEVEIENIVLSSALSSRQAFSKDGHKILIFSFDIIYSARLKDHLVLKGYGVVSTDTVDLFNQLLCNDFYDLIILDLNSDEYIQLILNLLRNVKNHGLYEMIPVIVISQINRTDIIQTFIEEQVDDYFLRSLDFLVLDIRINSFIEKKKVIEQGQKYLDLVLHGRKYFENELIEAGNYIENLLPKKIQNEFLSSNWVFVPSERIGGDFFNYYFINDDLIIYLIDISGHGIGSALLSLSVSSVINSYIINTNDVTPSKVLRYVNSYFVKFKSDMFITLWYGVLNVKTRHLRFASAGAPPAVVLNHQDNIYLQSRGTILGVGEIYSYEENEYVLSKFSHLLLFSDGVYEVENKQGVIMSIDNFYNVLKESSYDLDDFILVRIYEKMLDLSRYNAFRDDFSILEFILN